MFSYEYYEIFKTFFFTKNYMGTATSESITEFVQSIQIVQSF